MTIDNGPDLRPLKLSKLVSPIPPPRKRPRALRSALRGIFCQPNANTFRPETNLNTKQL